MPNTTRPALVVVMGLRIAGGEGVDFGVRKIGLPVACGDLRFVFRGRLADGSGCISELWSLGGAVGGALPIGVE